MVEQLLKCDLMRLGLLIGLHLLSARLFVFYGLKFCGLGGQLRVLYPKGYGPVRTDESCEMESIENFLSKY